MGKITLTKTIVGWIKQTQGSILSRGHDLAGLPPDAMSRTDFGFVHEDPRIFLEVTVEENRKLGLRGKVTCPL